MSGISDCLAATFGVVMGPNGAPSDTRAEALMASILLLAAQSDGTIAPAESAQLKQLISDRFANSDEETIASTLEPPQRIPHLSRPDDIIANADQALTPAQKEDLMLMVLQIIAADERKAPGELKFLDQLVDGLAISSDTMDRIYARYFAAKK